MSRSIVLAIVTVIFLGFAAKCQIEPVHLRCEYLENPAVIDVTSPHLSWINISPKKQRGQLQTAWEIRVAGTRHALLHGHADLWNSGKQVSNQSTHISYRGKPLRSRQDCWWQVRTWDQNGRVSNWSEPGFWSMGILDPAEWKAKWIGAPWQTEAALPKNTVIKPDDTTNRSSWPPPAPLLRKSFSIHKQIVSARAYVCGLGYFEMYVNGKKISQDVLVPNLTLYSKRPELPGDYLPLADDFKEYRVMYLCYDIKALLKKGENAIGAILGNGFYNAPRRWTSSYGSPRFLGQIYIKYSDGTEEVMVSDGTWKASRSPILMDLVYDGELYDARLEQPNWSRPGFNDSAWQYVAIRKAPEAVLKAQASPSDRVMERFSPQSVKSLGGGKYIVDFGQEISGWLHLLNVRGEPGRKIGIKYICESPVGSNSYILKGEGPESYAARFTWFVFREVEISNWPGELKPEQLLAEAVYTNVENTGKFETSDTLFNRINQIWVRAQKDNMHGCVASDCPHRERAPYTGDGQVACVTVMHNFDASAFYTKWIQDMLGAQNPQTGYVPNGAPWQPGCGGGVGWGAAIHIMPWEFYLQYGDTAMLMRNYEGMKAHIRYMLTWTGSDGIMWSRAPDSTRPEQWFNLGEWASAGKLPPDNLVHTFYLWRCLDFTSKAAAVLGYMQDAKYYAGLAERTRTAFQAKFYDPHQGTYGLYGANIFALKMGLPVDQLLKVRDALKSEILANGTHLNTGIFGTEFFFEVLAENGMQDLACEVMDQKTAPSYGWWITQGATTTWEQWNGRDSHNHPMFGGGLVWFYRKLAGINIDALQPGYRNIIFRPQPGGNISSAAYSNDTPYGLTAVHWQKNAGRFKLDITVPVGSTATVYVPSSNGKTVMENGRKMEEGNQIHFLKEEDGYFIYKVGSGDYSFDSLL